MFAHLVRFEGTFLLKKKSFAITVILFAVLGWLVATKARFAFPNTFRNAPYTITYIYCLFSLLAIFVSSLLASQSLFRETDTRFDAILFSTPVKKLSLLTSKLFLITLTGAVLFAFFGMALLLASPTAKSDPHAYGPYQYWNYIQPFVVILLPNILFCTAVSCSVGWLSQNKLMVYVSGMLIYFLYMAVSLFTNSPLMAGHSPASAEAMALAAKIDPFGVSAFFEQTRYWTSSQRNQQLLSLSGNLLFNRILYLCISAILISFSYRRFSFTHVRKKRRNSEPVAELAEPAAAPFAYVQTTSTGYKYQWNSMLSTLRLNIISVLKGKALLLLSLGWIFYLCIEMYSSARGGPRMPQQVGGTSFVINNIVSAFPTICLLALLFFGSDIYWRSRSVRFAILEDATPQQRSRVFFASLGSLILIMFLLLTLTVITGCALQMIMQSNIEWSLYLSLYYLLGFPLILSCVMIVSIQSIVNKRYTGVAVAALILLAAQTSFGAAIGIRHPLVRFANAFSYSHSEMSGYDRYLNAFHWNMLYWLGICIIMVYLVNSRLMQHVPKKRFRTRLLWPISALLLTVFSGMKIYKGTTIRGSAEVNDWKRDYEKAYGYWKQLPQPTVTDINTQIDLHPSSNSYYVSGRYKIVNKTQHSIDSILLSTPVTMQWKKILVENADLVEADAYFGQHLFRLHTTLAAGDSALVNFECSYEWNGFNKIDPFNAIVNNGAFMRISNYFPKIGYQWNNELDDPQERSRRGLPISAPEKAPYDANSENQDFIHINLILSTEENQTAIGIGELKSTWHKNKRAYFHYQTAAPVPFRFAVASGNYHQKLIRCNNTDIIAYYYPGHHRNIDHLLRVAQSSLEYCEQNFGPYPFHSLRLVEISSFTRGFAGTAYPNALFITEDFGYKTKSGSDPRRDIINELVSHEISHSWWGNAQISPDSRLGAKMLTETLAMYTELMIYKKTYGEEILPERVNIHKEIYLGERAVAGEQPLYKTDAQRTFQFYDKGMVVMYQLYKKLGEDKINLALRRFLSAYRYPHPAPRSIDFLAALDAVSDSTTREKISEWFKEMITYDLKISEAAVTKKEQQYELEIEIHAKKWNADSLGSQHELPFDEEVQMQITFNEGESKKIPVRLSGEKKRLRLQFPKKPISVVLDPEDLFIDVAKENNEKQIE